MEKESMLQMIRRMEEIGRLQKALSTRNTYIDRMVANARRDFTDEESRQYEENEKRIEECIKERTKLKQCIQEAIEEDKELAESLTQKVEEKEVKEPSILYMLSIMKEKKEQER